MSELARAFTFCSPSAECDTSGCSAVCLIPPGVTNRDELFDVMAESLRFPIYFGRNWDALSDCLRDLSWLRKGRVLILHEDLPSLDDGALRSYL
jgi:hypothetical protein